MTSQLERLRTALAHRYSVERELGRGGMASVYLANDRVLERCVALKAIREDLAAHLPPRRFLHEIKVTARLTHPFIPPLYDVGVAEGLLYYVMAYLEDPNLRERLRDETQLSIDDAVQVTCEVADALSYAHAHGVIHRDIKPGNILFQGGHAVVADFGIALAVIEVGGSKLTESGVAIGTPEYMSSEQARGSRHLDGRTDVYSLGCVLYEMLTGERPFSGTTHTIMLKHVNAERPSVRVVRDTVPEAVDAVVRRAMARDPAERFDTGNAFAAALRDAWHQVPRAVREQLSQSVERTPPSPRTARRRAARQVVE